MVDEDATRTDDHPEPTIETLPTVRRVELDDATSVGSGDRFVECGVLGVGGMGEVHELLDRRLGRVVARKRMTEEHGRARFIREIRIQAQLEHPAIVPVYDFAKEEGRPTFTMKRVQGRTLLDVLSRAQDVDERFAPRRLLEALAKVALAVDYAHSRGVVHRDLKPANIMLGEWGEVYVLDWGVARVLHHDREAAVELEPGDMPERDHTSLVGTPGYIAPEVLRGSDAGSVASDVYALGCILFRIATGEMLHEGDVEQRHAATLAGTPVDARLDALQVELAPELLAICRRATGPREQRHPSARAFHDELQRYLDGDRDLLLRRNMADRLSERAARSLERAAEGDHGERRNALRSLAAALALSPDHPAALRGLFRLLTERPREIPVEVREQLQRHAAARTSAMARPAALSGVLLLTSIGMLAWMGIRNWALVAVMVAAGALAMGAVLHEGQRASRHTVSEPRSTGRRDLVPLLAIGLSIATLSLATTPWLVVPPVVTGVTILRILRDHRQGWIVGVVMCASALTPWLLEASGLIAPSLSFTSGAMTIHPLAVQLPSLQTQLFLVLGALLGVTISIRTTRAFSRTLARAELDVALHAWQLRHMLPPDVSPNDG